jgi:hypothetical protein
MLIFLRRIAFGACFLLSLVVTAPVQASFHLWQIDQIFSDASGNVQFVEFFCPVSGENFLSGHALVDSQGSAMHSFVFPSDLPGDTANKHFLVATQAFADLHIVTPDYIVPNGFLFTGSGSLNYAGVDAVTYNSLPSDGVTSINRSGAPMANLATNFAGQSGSVSSAAPPPAPPPPAPSATMALENPQPGSFQSGIGLFSGWSCQGPSIAVSVDGGAALITPYGSARADTAPVCGAGNINTGFGLLFNFNTLGAGTHSAQVMVNGQAQGSPTSFTVVVPSGEFLSGVSREITVNDFPSPGKTTTLIWQQSQQNFAIERVQ